MNAGTDRAMKRTGLAWRIAAAASLLTAIVVVLLGAISYTAMQEMTRRGVTEALRNFASHQAEDTGVRLSNIKLALESLAGNTLIGNALVDDLGRDVYLQSFLSGYTAVGDVPVHVFVTNFAGKPFASNAPGLRMAIDPQWVRSVVDDGKQAVRVVDHGGLASIVIATPIFFVNTGRPEGALVFQVTLWDLTVPASAKHRQPNSDLTYGSVVSLEQDGRTFTQTIGAEIADEALSETRTIDVPEPLSGLNPMVTVVADQSVLHAPLDRLLWTYVIIGLLVLFVVTAASLLLANWLTARLSRLEASAAAIVADNSFERRLPVEGRDETAGLAMTFNAVLGALEQAYRDLERRSRIELDRSEEKYRRVVEQAGDAMLIFDPIGHVLDANASAARLLKHPRERLIGMAIDDLTPDPAGRIFDRRFTEMLDRPTLSFDGDVKRSDGGHIRVEIHASLINVGDGHQILWMMHDVSERRAVEAMRARLLARLEASNTELRQFAYVASHDLQEPLRMISSYLRLLERRYKEKLDIDAREFIEFAVDGADRMGRLIRDLLAYSRLDTQGEPFAAVAMTTVFSDTLINLSVAVADAGATVATPKDAPPVWGDQTQLVSLFQNLIGNAVKYHAPDRPPEVAVSWRADEADPGDVHFAVTDNGIGIAPEFHDRIFLIFQRLHGRDEYEGTGIGLAMCKRIVERHRGRIWVESTPGEGSTFHCVLPGVAHGKALAEQEADEA